MTIVVSKSKAAENGARMLFEFSVFVRTEFIWITPELRLNIVFIQKQHRPTHG
ncbi:MAG: hypothetical protein WBJ21_11610 [Burkholderiaceae bacterium]